MRSRKNKALAQCPTDVGVPTFSFLDLPCREQGGDRSCSKVLVPTNIFFKLYEMECALLKLKLSTNGAAYVWEGLHACETCMGLTSTAISCLKPTISIAMSISPNPRSSTTSADTASSVDSESRIWRRGRARSRRWGLLQISDFRKDLNGS